MGRRVNELDLDHAFWRLVSTDQAFRTWLISRTKFHGRSIDLVADEKWHQRWYRDPDTGKDSETDILLILLDRDTHDRYALHIENKPDHRKWEPGQASNYRKRDLDRMSKWRYVDFQTMLIAPTSFISRFPLETSAFELAISYEEIAAFAPGFGTPGG